MNRDPTADRRLAQALAESSNQPLSILLSACSQLLEDAFRDFRSDVGYCSVRLDQLLPFTARAIGAGYLQTAHNNATLRDYVRSLHLGDLLLASACLLGDTGAGRRLQYLVENRVRPTLIKRWKETVRGPVLDETISALSGHALLPPSKGQHVGIQRLATFQGRSSLVTWLHSVALHLIKEACRGRALHSTEDHSAPMARAEADFPHMTAHGEKLREQLVQALRDVLAEMPPRRRLVAVLHWVRAMSASLVASHLRVSRPAVSQHLEAARAQIRLAVEKVTQQIAMESGRTPRDIELLIEENLGYLLTTAPESSS